MKELTPPSEPRPLKSHRQSISQINSETLSFECAVSSSQSKSGGLANPSTGANVGGKAVNSFKKAVTLKAAEAASEDAKPLVGAAGGR